jgi:hypothetical protein
MRLLYNCLNRDLHTATEGLLLIRQADYRNVQLKTMWERIKFDKQFPPLGTVEYV